jgi:hypothetical protein
VVSYASSTYERLPPWEVNVELPGESYIKLRERFLPSENNLSTGPASLTEAEVLLAGSRQTTANYWRLVYSARRHNRNVRYWVVLDPPIELAGVEEAVHVVEIVARDSGTWTVNTLGSSFQVVASPEVLSFNKRLADRPFEVSFQRGDVNTDGEIDAADAVRLIGYLFLGANPPPCLKAADADDDGQLNINDPIAIFKHLFGGVEAVREPLARCGGDPTEDRLSCQSYPPCQ